MIHNESISDPYNVVDLFFESAQKYPDRTAIVYKNEQASFGELAQEVNYTASHFVTKGISKGDRVLIFVPMSLDLYRILLALFRIGATAVFLDEWVSKARMEECCKVAQCKAFIGIPKARVLSWFSYELRKIPIHLGIGYTKNNNSEAIFPETNSLDTALISFTTGSTGIPKAAKRTHGFLREQAKALLEKIQPQENDVDLQVLPIALLINLGSGVTSVIADFKAGKPDSFKPERAIAQIKKHHVNRIIASPFFIKQVSRYLIRHNIPLPQIKKIFTGGAPVFPSEAYVYFQAFSDAEIEIVYGSTEAEPISSINARELVNEISKTNNGLKVGKPEPCAEVKIIRIVDAPISVKAAEDLEKLEVQGGEIGEIIVSGSHVLREYYNNEEALHANKIFIEDTCWHRTGDSGYLDEQHQLYLTGRCNTLIKYHTQFIAPFIYENIFQSWEGVELGTIVMVNENLTAVIELNDRKRKKAVLSKIGELDLPIQDIFFIKKIPRDPRHNSKIEYQDVRKLVKN
ncbi:MAG: AMP-binding protein [Cytophagaceae bacterium]